MVPFDFQPRTRIVFGPGTLERLGELASELGARRALVVSDRGIVAAGHTMRGLAALERAGIETILFQDVHENPTTDDVEAGRQVAARFEPELIVGLGGGSSMDCAKGINFVHSNGGQIRDYWGVGKALREMLPMIAVPTTAGTGSETQSFALISDAKTHVKMACGDKKASFRIALLDPQLTVTQPARITALTGVDAMAHAVESYVTSARSDLSQSFSLESWRLLAANFPVVLDDPENLEARAGMQLGASLAGLAIENAMLGAAHALANPLTARYGIAHGQAIATMLPHVVRFNGPVSGREYLQLWQAHAVGEAVTSQEQGIARLADYLVEQVRHARLPTRLRDQQVDRDALDQLAADAAKQWTAGFNPRPVTPTDLLALYEAAW